MKLIGMIFFNITQQINILPINNPQSFPNHRHKVSFISHVWIENRNYGYFSPTFLIEQFKATFCCRFQISRKFAIH